MHLSEDDVCEGVVKWLKCRGFSDASAVKAGARGIDIVAGPTSNHPGWMMEAKGAIAPDRNENRKPYANGGIFMRVSQAFNTAACLRDHEQRNGRSVAIAIPCNKWFYMHSKKLERACSELGISIFRVHEDGQISVTLNDRKYSPALDQIECGECIHCCQPAHSCPLHANHPG